MIFGEIEIFMGKLIEIKLKGEILLTWREVRD